MFEFPLRLPHDFAERLLGLCLRLGSEDKAHAAARHASEHPETAKPGPEAFPHAVDDRFGVEVRGPGDDGLDRAKEVPRRSRGDSVHVAHLNGRDDLVEHKPRFPAGLPFRLAAKQILLGHHLENRPHVLGHAPVNEHQCFLQVSPDRHRVMTGQQPAATRAMLRITLSRRHAANELGGRPHAT